MYQEVFDTNRICEDLEDFLDRSEIPDGHIITIACKDDMITCLSKKAIKWIEDELGSKEISKLKF